MAFDARTFVLANTALHARLSRTPRQEVSAMSVARRVPRETHPASDQFFRVEAGEGLFEIGAEEFHLTAGDVAFVPAGTPHAIENLGAAPLKLLTVYSPPPAED